MYANNHKSGLICSIVIIYFVLLYIMNILSCLSIMLILGQHNITSMDGFIIHSVDF